MLTKTKKSKISLEQLGQRLGIVLMTAAATVGMLELPDHPSARIALPNQPSFVFAENEELNNPLRREKEETDQHYISYSVTQRTPARSGKR